MANNNTDTGDTTILSTTTTRTTTSLQQPDDPFQEAPRESLITTAVSFLQNTKVRHTTLVQKQQFLRSKGLTAHEIQLACERAGVFSQDPNNPNTVIQIGSQLQTQLLPQPTVFGRIREILHSTAALGGVMYAVYLFWKKYLAPFLFGQPKKKPVDEALADIDKKVELRSSELNKEISLVKDLISTQQKDQSHQLNREFNQFRSDLDAIKGLLLNRKQFASPVAPVTIPSIPAWQLAASSPRHHHRDSQSDDIEKVDDAGSGSGSSETEVVTKNSDSSLEIM